MGNTMKRICTICARGGSKGVKNKNIRILSGKPLIAHTIKQAKDSGIFDLVAVSSDSLEILRVAQEYGADLVVERPIELASDFISKIPGIRHCVETAERTSGLKFDIVVDLDATSPLRIIEDIRGAVSLLEETKVSNVITGSPARRSPYFNLVEVDKNGFVGLSKPPVEYIARRQDSPSCYDMNASIYVWWRSSLFQFPTVFNNDTKLFIMPENRSTDIDNEFDFEIVEIITNKRLGQ